VELFSFTYLEFHACHCSNPCSVGLTKCVFCFKCFLSGPIKCIYLFHVTAFKKVMSTGASPLDLVQLGESGWAEAHAEPASQPAGGSAQPGPI
jgi:hypothetical protein